MKSNLFLLEDDNIERESPVNIFVSDLKKYLLCPGDIFWQKKSGKPIRLYRAGDRIRLEHVGKFEKVSQDFLITWSCSPYNIKRGMEHVQFLHDAQLPLHQVQSRDTILKWINQTYWDGDSGGSLLDLMLTMAHAFEKFNPEHAEVFEAWGVDLTTRNALVSSIFVTMALALGYTDYKYLQDLYHIVYLTDSSLMRILTPNLLRALKMAQGDYQAASDFLKKNSPSEYERFASHVEKSHMLIRNKFTDILNYEHSSNIILRHHEKITGQGYPKFVTESEMSDLEKLYIFLWNYVPLEPVELKLDDGREYLKKMLYPEDDSILAPYLSKQLKNMISKVFWEFGNKRGHHQGIGA